MNIRHKANPSAAGAHKKYISQQYCMASALFCNNWVFLTESDALMEVGLLGFFK